MTNVLEFFYIYNSKLYKEVQPYENVIKYMEILSLDDDLLQIPKS